MKKIAFLLILCCLGMPFMLLTSCQSDAYKSYRPLKAANEDEQISLCFEHAYTKTTPAYQMTDTATYQVRLAKNETENCQFILYSPEEKAGLSAQVTAFTDALGNTIPAEIYKVHYINTNGVESPDPLPKLDSSFYLEAGRAQAFIIQLTSTAETPAGSYEATLDIKSGDLVVKTATVFAKVWDFTLPDTPSSATAIGLSRGETNIYNAHNIDLQDEEAKTEMYVKYYEYLMEHRMSGYDLPYDVLDDRADKYMSDPRVTSFRVPYYPDDNYITACYEKLSKNQEWLDKAYFYPVDEPISRTLLINLRNACERLERLFPGYNIVVPFFTDIDFSSDVDQIDFMKEYTNIWCPKTFLYTDYNLLDTQEGVRTLYDEAKNAKYAPFAERMQEEQTGGDKVWWYVCWEPGFPYANMYVDMPGVVHRVMFWQQKQYNVDGFLYWNSAYWSETENPWTDMATVKTLSDKIFGDGSLFYDGYAIGLDGPVGSLRIEALRDGLDDYDYLMMAEELLGKEETDEIISRVSTNIVEFTQDDEVFAEARIALGDAIEKASK